MRLTDLALKRPIAVSMIFLALGLVGFLSWQRLPLELMPSLNYPQLTIVANCENTAPLEMETLVTKTLESSLGTVSRVRRINSYSREGVSLITLDFDWGTNMNYASLDVREKLDQVRDLLPKEAATPMIIRYDPASLPVVTLAIKGEALGFEDLQELVSGTIKRELERVAGVASARLSGAQEREILVAVHSGRLLAQKVSISSLVEALKQANLNFPGGKIVQHQHELHLRVLGEFKEVSDLGKVGLLRRPGGPGGPGGPAKISVPAFVREVAEVQDTFKKDQSVARLNGQPSLILAIFKMADANTVQVAERVKARVTALNQEYAGRLQIMVAQDQGRFIRQAIFQLEEAALLGGLLSFGVLFGFLASFPSALIIMTAIPLSILATFSLMYLAGISLNMMSLGGLALGVGMLVDNGVVVLENIRRHEESGQATSLVAIARGTDEVKMAVTASTLAHMVVFVPVIFVGGIAGQFLYQVGLTISFSLLISLAVALILNPMLVSVGRPWISRSLTAESRSWGLELKERLDGVYVRLLTTALNRRRPVLLAAALLTGVGLLILIFLGRELLPALDQREFLLRVSTSPNTSFAATSERLRTIEDLLLAQSGVDTVITQLGYNPKEQYEKVMEEKEPRAGTLMVTLKPRGQYAGSAATAVDELRPRLSQIPDTKIEYIFPQSLGQWLSQKPQLPELLTVQGPELGVLETLSREVLARVQKVRGLKDLETSLKKEDQESRVVLDRERAASFGLSVKEIGETLKVCIQGEVSTQFRQADKDIDIRVQLSQARQQTLPELAKIYIHSKQLKTDIPLQAVARIESGPGLREVHRRDQERIVAVQGNVVGRSLGDCQQDIHQALKDFTLPPGYTLVQSGEALEMGRSFNTLFWALLLSVLLVYMILAGQFESLLNPFIILCAIPFSLVGVALALWLTGWGISLGVYFGAIMLGGIVVNNSILLIDYTNTLRRQGHGLLEAVIQGSRARLRPIIMTTLTTSLGLLPLVLSRGEGAELRVPLALTVLGGLIASTFLTLILVPLLYLLSEERLGKWRLRKPREQG